MAYWTSKKCFIILTVLVSLIFLGKLISMKNNYLFKRSLQKKAHELPILVSVYYEALCPDSKYFILKQLLPVYREASSIIDVEFVPYGKAQTIQNSDGSFSFECQHGPVECAANIYHACAVDSVKNTSNKLELVACMINDNSFPEKALYKCANLISPAEFDSILQCYGSLHGKKLLRIFGDATNSLRPPVSFIPTVVLDGKQGKQSAILKNLLAEICAMADSQVNICNKR